MSTTDPRSPSSHATEAPVVPNAVDPPTKKVDFAQVPAAALAALRGMESYLRECGLEKSLVHLVKLLSSYRNGCAYCVDMHTKDLRALGESEMRLFGTSVWRDTPFFTARERAAFALAEVLTHLDGRGVPDAVFDEVRRSFSESELVSLMMVILAINMWNRFTAVVHSQAGSYRPSASAPASAPAPAASEPLAR